MYKRISAIVIKEFHHISRDWQTLIIVLIMPVIMMFLYGYALTMDLRDVPVIIVDPSPSTESQKLSSSINATELFAVTGSIRSADNPVELFKRYHAKAIIRLSPDFAADLRNGGSGAPVQVLIDGSDPNIGTILKNTMEPLLMDIVMNILDMQPPIVINVQSHILYNPQQKSALYFVPGLMAVILLMISAILTSLALTREKELGTLEQLLVSPLVPGEIIIGKLIPYMFLSALDGALILIVGKMAFGIEVAGDMISLATTSFVYIFTSLAMGLLISTIAATQQQAMMMVLPATMLPTIILSGFIFPLTSLPVFLQVISSVIPATYYLKIIRGIVLKGVGISVLWQPAVILLAMGLFLVTVSIKKFKVKI
ncbi:MAG TPA: ABC transporter permease [Chitinispirillaceae bacterium]|nr:ABC transporter permease [Chitinispirillaceae bacterium]